MYLIVYVYNLRTIDKLARFMENQVIGGQYVLQHKIGSGSFGQIFECQNIKTRKKYAAKIESHKAPIPQLSGEAKVYNALKNGVNIPKIHWYRSEGSNNIMIMDLLGKSLETYHLLHNKMSLKSVLMLMDQMLTAIEFMHEMGFVHRDIKPDNFVFGIDDKEDQLFMIDFGLSKRYRNRQTQEHIKYCNGKSLTGTARYASVAALKGIEQSRRDDMEALGFVWIYLLKGTLPWMGLQTIGRKQKYEAICNCKARTSFESLCEGLPKEFVDYFKIVRNLGFDERPNYSEIRAMFRDLFIRSGFVYDHEYDWKTSTDKPKMCTPPRRPPPHMPHYSPDVRHKIPSLLSPSKVLSVRGHAGVQGDSVRAIGIPSVTENDEDSLMNDLKLLLNFSGDESNSSSTASSSLPPGWSDSKSSSYSVSYSSGSSYSSSDYSETSGNSGSGLLALYMRHNKDVVNDCSSETSDDSRELAAPRPVPPAPRRTHKQEMDTEVECSQPGMRRRPRAEAAPPQDRKVKLTPKLEKQKVAQKKQVDSVEPSKLIPRKRSAPETPRKTRPSRK